MCINLSPLDGWQKVLIILEYTLWIFPLCWILKSWRIIISSLPPSSFLSKVRDALRKNFYASKNLSRGVCSNLRWDREVTQEEAKPEIFPNCARNAKIGRHRAGISASKVSQKTYVSFLQPLCQKTKGNGEGPLKWKTLKVEYVFSIFL